MPLNNYWASGGNDRHYLTLSLYPKNNPTDVERLVRYGNPNAPGSGLDAYLETGEAVFYRRSGIAFTRPDVGDFDRNQTLNIVLDNVSLEAGQRLRAWRDADSIVIVEYRAYLKSDLSAPVFGPTIVELDNIQVKATRITGRCLGIQVLRRDFPNLIWTPSIAPGLVRT